MSFVQCIALAITVMFTGILSVGCAAPSPATPQTRAVTYALPEITPQAESNRRQEKGGIEISFAPAKYEVKREERHTYQPSQPRGMTMIMGPSGDVPQVHVDWTKQAAVTVEPDRIKFLVKVNNKSSRVFRGAGMVVQFNVDGQLQPVEQEGYAKLTNAIVPPRGEDELDIVGPSLTSLKKPKGLIGVFLYDVVTKQNDAGVVTEKQNFEWYFDYALVSKTEDAPFASGFGYMPVPAYRQWQVEEQARNK